MNTPYNSFKVFSDIKGQKVLDFSILEYKKEITGPDGQMKPLLVNGQPVYRTGHEGNPEFQEFEKETKGFRLKVEGTDNGWQKKTTIYLQDQEVTDFAAVLLGKKKNMKAQRPEKTLTLEHQGTHCFLSLSHKEKEGPSKLYGGKIQSYDSIKLLGVCSVIVQQELKRESGVALPPDQLLRMLDGVYSSYITSTVPVVPVVNSTEGHTPIVDPTGKTVCSKCGCDLSDEKSKRVVDFSMKKFGAPVCYKCQQGGQV